MLTYLSNESRIIPLTMATRSSAKLLHSKSYAGGRQRHVQARKDPFKGAARKIHRHGSKSHMKFYKVVFISISSCDGCPCTLTHMNLQSFGRTAVCLGCRQIQCVFRKHVQCVHSVAVKTTLTRTKTFDICKYMQRGG